MLSFLADENFNNNIIRGILRRRPEIDIVRVQDVGLGGAGDPAVFEVGKHVPIATAIDDLILIAEVSYEGEWEGQVRYLPLR